MQKIKTEIKSSTSFLYTRSFFFILIACVVFLLPKMSSTETTTITAIVAVVLFSIGPLGQIVLGIPFFTKAELAVAGIKQLEERLDEISDVKETSPESRIAAKRTFQSLRLEQMSFSYTDPEGQQTFTVGPIDMTIGKGELIIIAGGNGSGKTTLLKLIAGLYYPQSGSMFLDEVLVKPSNYEHYRKLFSIILSDFHIFDRMYGLDDIDYEQLGYLMDKMQLSKKTAYIDGRFTNLDLSAGQKKRLALVTSYLDDKPILIFDEIAADLDPEFRSYYYDVHLKQLRESGKTIIVVSHDDRYFHMGDRFFKMDYGRIVV
jgi:putative pyoverdin transport system ATP-binding/permease protein